MYVVAWGIVQCMRLAIALQSNLSAMGHLVRKQGTNGIDANYTLNDQLEKINLSYLELS